jgi:hypothetical protein
MSQNVMNYEGFGIFQNIPEDSKRFQKVLKIV